MSSKASLSGLDSPPHILRKNEESLGLVQRDWTDAEEARAKRKVDLIVMPCLILGFFALQMDRGNIGNALTDFFFRDVGITQNQFNVGQQLLSVGIVLLEIPSNMVLYRVGPQRWLSGQIFAWGLVSTFQAFQHGLGPFLATRLLLGLCESGFIPGSLYVLTTWYTRKETAKRVMIYFVGNLSASATSNLIAYGVLHMRGVAGKPGWFWLFLLEGLFTILVALLFAMFLPDSTDKPTPLLLPRLKYFTERELYILKHRVLLDDPTKAKKRPKLHGRHVWALFKSPFVWPHILITLLNNAPLSAFSSYAPSIVATFGYDRLKANAMASVGNFINIPVSVALAYCSDRFNLRGITTIIALAFNFAFTLFNRQISYSNDQSARYAAIVLVISIAFSAHPLNISWLALNCKSSEERAAAMAFIIMSANAAGIIGSQLFRSDDAPRYHRGLSVILAFITTAWVIAMGLYAFYKFIGRKPLPEQLQPAEQTEEKEDLPINEKAVTPVV